MAKDQESPELNAALHYLSMGWAVIPAAKRSKRPVVPWQTYQEKLPSKAQVREWFARRSHPNLCVVTGKVSGLVVLDVDPAHGGKDSIATLEARHGALPKTPEVITGGGGRHIYFAHPGRETRNRAGLAPGLDLRGDGGVIVVPPSIHPSGKAYRWRSGHNPDDIDLAPLPIWLVEPRFGGDERLGHPLAYWRTLVQEGVGEGRRNSTIASFTGHLLWNGVDPDVIMELMLAWNRVRCSPPLSDDEVVRTVRSIERTHRQHHEES